MEGAPMIRVETDRHPGRRIFFTPLEETVGGLEVTGRVRLKPRMLQIEVDHWVRVDAQEVLYLEEDLHGQTHWVTLRGRFRDLEKPRLREALDKACRSGVFLQVSPHYAVAPSRILGVRLQRQGPHRLEVEGLNGDVVELPLDPQRLGQLEVCLDALDLGGGFLLSEPEED
jgi:hypothetical protein